MDYGYDRDRDPDWVDCILLILLFGCVIGMLTIDMLEKQQKLKELQQPQNMEECICG